MNSKLPPVKRTAILLILLFTSFFVFLQAQSTQKDICIDEDCSSKIFEIELNQPLLPEDGNYSMERTVLFKNAYLKFKEIVKEYNHNAQWQTDYEAFQLGGKNCFRHYQLESFFAYEYEFNWEFAKFIKTQEADISAFQKQGFRGSRRGLNLKTRMDKKCPGKLKDTDSSNGLALENLPPQYQKLGQVQGYFDEEGNLIKPLEMPENQTIEEPDKLTKNEQIAELKQKLNSLPTGTSVSDRIAKIESELNSAQPGIGGSQSYKGKCEAEIRAVISKVEGLHDRQNNIRNLLSDLKSSQTTGNQTSKVAKINSLNSQNESLNDRLYAADDKAKTLKNGQGNQKSGTLESELAARKTAVGKLKRRLNDLKIIRTDLTQRLEDKPKRILGELTLNVNQTVERGGDLEKQIEEEERLKDELLKQLIGSANSKKDCENELKNLEAEVNQLDTEIQKLENDTYKTADEIDNIKRGHIAAEALKNLKSESEMSHIIQHCESEMNAMMLKVRGIENRQKKLNRTFIEKSETPNKLFDKLGELRSIQNRIKSSGSLSAKSTEKLNNLISQGDVLSSKVGILSSKMKQTKAKNEGFDNRFSDLRRAADLKAENLKNMQSRLSDLFRKKSSLERQLNGNITDFDAEIDDLVRRFNLFEQENDCEDLSVLEADLVIFDNDINPVAFEIEELDKNLTDAANDEFELRRMTYNLENETSSAASLKSAEENIKKEFGKDIKLEPVTMEEWSESFEVKREYWNAEFHPDNEVVEGFSGRYFEVKLKDADKNVKLLFGPGKYFMDKKSFRESYGSVIVAFVTEALHAVKNDEQGMVKLFIQGGADIAGHQTFKGNLDSQYLYEEISFLPQIKGQEGFSSTPSQSSVPKSGFRNDDLPNLRGNFLKEMVSIYSKKLNPILLEGEVKSAKNAGDRNAIIYLFIPDSVTE